MTIASISICTRLGSPLFARNYVAISQSRLEGLLASFPRLLTSGQQHSFVEGEDVRFLFQPLDQLYLVLLTPKASNLLQDLETLQLASRVVSHLCGSGEEVDILEAFGDLLFAFDEIVTATYADQITLPQITSNLAMESQEEALQELIEKNKIQEAREVGRQKMKQLELAKREGARKGGYGGSSPASASMEAVHVATEVVDTVSGPSAKGVKTLKAGKGMSLKKY